MESAPALARSGPAAFQGGLARGAPLTRGAVLGLQQGAGNAAVSRMLQERRLARAALAEPEAETETEPEPEAEIEPEVPAGELPPAEEPEDPGGGEEEAQAEEGGDEPAAEQEPAAGDAEGASFDGAPPQAGEAESMAPGREPDGPAEEEEPEAKAAEAPEEDVEDEEEEDAEPDEDASTDEAEMEPGAADEAASEPAAGVARLARLTNSKARSAAKDDVLSVGDKGSAVRALQRNLRSLGWYRGALDGEFGAKTESAVRRFQARRGLEADGAAGPSTRRALARGIKIKKEIKRLGKLIADTDRPGGAMQHMLKQIEELRKDLRKYQPQKGSSKPKPPKRPKPQKDESGAARGGRKDAPEGNPQTGIVGDSDGVPVKLRERASTNSPVVAELGFGTRLFIKRRVSGGWYEVMHASGKRGFVAAAYVKRNLPEPTARLFKINGESALRIATHFYGHLGTDGQDMRFYVNVLEYVNRGPGDRGIYQSKPNNKSWDAWKDVKTRSGFQIWVPGDKYAKDLKGTVASGSLTGGALAKARRVANAVEDFLIGGAAFVAGLFSGAYSSVKGMLVDAKDLIVALWNVMTSTVKELVSKGKDLWNRVSKLKPGEIASSHFKRFAQRWKHPDMWERWKFRGFIAGFALVEIALLFLTAGIGATLKLAKLGRMLKGFVKELPRNVADSFIRRFKRTGPSRKPNPNAQAGGHPAQIPKGQKKQDVIRSLQLENQAADALAKAGYKVEQRPGYGKPNKPGEPDPDFKVEGRIFDCYSPGATKAVRGIWSEVDNKVKKGQTQRVVLNLTDWTGDLAKLQAQFKDWPIKGLHEVLIVNNGGAVTRLEL